MTISTRILFAGLLGLSSVLAQSENPSQYIRYSGPEMFDFSELVSLSEDPLDSPLTEKLKRITTTPFISNEARYRGAKPKAPDIQNLGPALRMMFWNIERGVHLDQILTLLGDPDRFLDEAQSSSERRHSEITPSPEAGAAESNRVENAEPAVDLEALQREVKLLRDVDLIVLNEVDWGMPRSAYREVVRELGEALNMNWVYGVEFVEIDPVVLGTEGFEDVEDPDARQDLLDETRADREKLRALHGTAILSRYPIRAATLQPFETRAYDWYHTEKGIRPVESGIRAGARIIGEDMHREMRRGGRTMLIAHLDVPALPEGRLTVVSPHLENRAKPKHRQRQMEEALAAVKGLHNPVIIAGDLNTTGSDGEAFRMEKHVYNKYTEPDTWVNMGIKTATGVGIGYDLLQKGFTFARNVSDPTVHGVPFFAPNKERDLFDTVERFRFEDGFAFDFRGEVENASEGHAGMLANSNQRAAKGFVPTYDFVITVGIVGKYKLDWIFVKSYLNESTDSEGSRIFAPFFARTLTQINSALDHSLSDHNPMTVDLPFRGPPRP